MTNARCDPSLDGKVVSGVAQAARAIGVPVVVFAGRVQVDRETCRRHGICEALALQRAGMPQEASIAQTRMRLRETAAQWYRACV